MQKAHLAVSRSTGTLVLKTPRLCESHNSLGFLACEYAVHRKYLQAFQVLGMPNRLL